MTMKTVDIRGLGRIQIQVIQNGRHDFDVLCYKRGKQLPWEVIEPHYQAVLKRVQKGL